MTQKTPKTKVVGYVTTAEKNAIQERAKELGMTLGAYFHELVMWDARYNLIPRLRNGEEL